MISALSGQLRHVDEDRVHLQSGPILYELLVPAADIPDLQSALNTELTLHTIFYFAGDPSRGNIEPTLIGFLRPHDKRFFQHFTTVKGIGPRTALRALTVPVGQIAHAIESKDARFLTSLKGIGKRTAELIIAELSGKVQLFAAPAGHSGPTPPISRHSDIEEDAVVALISLGERRSEAEQLLQRVKQLAPTLKTTDQLLREMLRIRG